MDLSKVLFVILSHNIISVVLVVLLQTKVIKLVSLFTINNKESIFCGSGGQCDVTNSNSSFGEFGLVADGVGPRQFTGIISATSDVNADTFTLHVDRADPINITNAVYDSFTGLTTITTASNHGYNVGAAITISGLKFTCDSTETVTDFNVNAALMIAIVVF